LAGTVRNSLLISYSFGFAKGFEFAFHKFRGVIHAKDFDSLVGEILGKRSKFNKMLSGFVARFHEVDKNETRITTNKKYKILIRPERGRKGAAYIAMNALE
jgi:hypothetical protein